jgi:hypothetical protein
MALSRGAIAISTSTPTGRALKSLRSTVRWSWTNVKRSLFALENSQPLRKPIMPLGLLKGNQVTAARDRNG